MVCGFGVALLVCLILGLGQQKLSVDQRETDQKEAKAKLTASEIREQTNQTNLQTLVAFNQARPGGLTESERLLIQSFGRPKPPEQHNETGPQPSKNLPTPDSLRQLAFGLSAEIESSVGADTKAYTIRQQDLMEQKRKEFIASGLTEQQADWEIHPQGSGNEYARVAAMEEIKTAAANKYATQVQELLDRLDDLNLDKTRGYLYARFQAEAEQEVHTACLPARPHLYSCPVALEKLAKVIQP